MDKKEQRLLENLTALTGHDIHRLLDYVAMPIEQPERMNAAPDDYHPPGWRMEFYARAVTELLVRNGHLKFKPKPAAAR